MDITERELRALAHDADERHHDAMRTFHEDARGAIDAGRRRFLVGDTLTIADIALYAYTHVADEGGFDLKAFPNVKAWCEVIALQPGHVAIDA